MKVSIHEIPERNSIKFDKRTDIYNNGDDNAYPTLIERIINSSVTAKSCAGVMANFMYCQGFEFENNLRQSYKQSNQKFDRRMISINKKGDTPNSLLRKACRKSISRQSGVFFSVQYNALYQKTSIDIVPFKYCRLGKKDSEDYHGKVIVYNNWDKENGTRIKKQDFNFIDVFNPNPKVIQAQVDAAGGWKNYKGQILFLNLDDNDTYPLSWIDPVLLDCDSESQASVYKNRGLRKGFFGKYIFGTKEFEKEEDYNDFNNDLKDFVGAENADSIMTIELRKGSENLDDEMIIKPIERNSEDGFFAHTETSSANNIRKAAANIPPVLIDYVAGKLGGTSGAEFQEAQLFYQRQLEEERNDIEDTFETLFTNFYKPVNDSGDWSIKKIIDDSVNTEI